MTIHDDSVGNIVHSSRNFIRKDVQQGGTVHVEKSDAIPRKDAYDDIQKHWSDH